MNTHAFEHARWNNVENGPAIPCFSDWKWIIALCLVGICGFAIVSFWISRESNTVLWLHRAVHRVVEKCRHQKLIIALCTVRKILCGNFRLSFNEWTLVLISSSNAYLFLMKRPYTACQVPLEFPTDEQNVVLMQNYELTTENEIGSGRGNVVCTLSSWLQTATK